MYMFVLVYKFMFRLSSTAGGSSVVLRWRIIPYTTDQQWSNYICFVFMLPFLRAVHTDLPWNNVVLSQLFCVGFYRCTRSRCSHLIGLCTWVNTNTNTKQDLQGFTRIYTVYGVYYPASSWNRASCMAGLCYNKANWGTLNCTVLNTPCYTLADCSNHLEAAKWKIWKIEIFTTGAPKVENVENWNFHYRSCQSGKSGKLEFSLQEAATRKKWKIETYPTGGCNMQKWKIEIFPTGGCNMEKGENWNFPYRRLQNGKSGKLKFSSQEAAKWEKWKIGIFPTGGCKMRKVEN